MTLKVRRISKDILCKRCRQPLENARVIVACEDPYLGARIIVKCAKCGYFNRFSIKEASEG